jgi:hypothetical protein
MMLALLSGILLLGFAQTAHADRRGGSKREFRDSRYSHDRYYPVRGQFLKKVPSGNRVVVHGNSRYYFHGGVWYRPQGTRFAIVMPPIGLFVPFLPPYYTTIWLGGIPYYYANEVYYARRANGYVVVEPPKGEARQEPKSGQMFIYPRQGQSEETQATDRYECHRWAVDQTGYDPTMSPPEMPEAQTLQTKTEYQRAMGACLDGRGYTVK